jgi:hypothetical protein
MIKHDLAILILVIAIGILYNLPEGKIAKPIGMHYPVILDILNKNARQYKF